MKEEARADAAAAAANPANKKGANAAIGGGDDAAPVASTDGCVRGCGGLSPFHRIVHCIAYALCGIVFLLFLHCSAVQCSALYYVACIALQYITLHYTLHYAVHYTLHYTLHYPLHYPLYYTLHITHFTLHITHYIAHCTLHYITLHCASPRFEGLSLGGGDDGGARYDVRAASRGALSAVTGTYGGMKPVGDRNEVCEIECANEPCEVVVHECGASRRARTMARVANDCMAPRATRHLSGERNRDDNNDACRRRARPLVFVIAQSHGL